MLSVQDSKKFLQKTEWGLVIACHTRERADFKITCGHWSISIHLPRLNDHNAIGP